MMIINIYKNIQKNTHNSKKENETDNKNVM